eukprot:15454035-Alexandrium_andersonii.AAC.1
MAEAMAAAMAEGWIPGFSRAAQAKECLRCVGLSLALARAPESLSRGAPPPGPPPREAPPRALTGPFRHHQLRRAR